MERIEEKLTELLELLTDFYKRKLDGADLTSQEQKCLIQLLKDNAISLGDVNPKGNLLEDVSMENFIAELNLH